MLESIVVALTLVAAEPRPVVVISDLHMGEGKEDAKGQWDPYEDFRWADEFDEFLQAIGSAAPHGVDLVIAGDLLELWQSHDGRCPILEDRNLGCTQAEALDRLARVLQAHGRDLTSLRSFAERTGSEIVLIRGNHDVAVEYDPVAKQLLSVLGPNARFHDKGYWRSQQGHVVVDHGHMIGEDPNRFTRSPPFLKGHLQRPWGEQFVVAYYNQWEAKYPIVDNLTEELAGAKLVMAAEGPDHTPVELTADLVRFFFFDVSWAQLKQGLGGDDAVAPKWDVAKLRAKGDVALVEVLPPDDPMRDLIRNGRLPGAMKAFDGRDDDLRALCDKALVGRKARAKKGEAVVLPCPVVGGGLGDSGGLGALSAKIFGSRDKAVAARMREIQKELKLSDAEAFETFVYGHTHLAVPPFKPLRKGGWSPVALNSGAWQRTVTPARLHEYEPDPAKALRVPLEALPPCYTYVWIAPGKERKPQLRTWRKKDGVWDSGTLEECAAMPVRLP